MAEEKRRKEKDIELLAFNSNEYVEGASVAENAEVQIFFLLSSMIFTRRILC